MKIAGITSEKRTLTSARPGSSGTASMAAFQVRPLAATEIRFATSAANTSSKSASVNTPPSAFRSSLVESNATPATIAARISTARSASRRCGRSSAASSEIVTNSRSSFRPASMIWGSACTVWLRSSPAPEPSASCSSRIAPGCSRETLRDTIRSTPGLAVSQTPAVQPTTR